MVYRNKFWDRFIRWSLWILILMITLILFDYNIRKEISLCFLILTFVLLISNIGLEIYYKKEDIKRFIVNPEYERIDDLQIDENIDYV